MLAFHRTSRVEASGTHKVLLREFGGRLPVAQTFTMESEGLEEVRIRLWASEPSDVTFDWVLSEVRQGDRAVPLRGHRVRVRRLAGERWTPIRFPPIVPPATRTYRLDVRLVDVEWNSRGDDGGDNDRGVALVAWLDNSTRGGFLIVDGQERWGDLMFEARAAGDTIFGRFVLLTWPAFPPFGQHAAVLVLVFLLYNFLFVSFVIHFWPSGRVSPDYRPSPAVPTVRAESPLGIARGIAVVVTFIAAGVSVYALREPPPKIDLIDELYAADLRSPDWTLHTGFQIVDRTVDEQLMRAITQHPPSQITWMMTVPAQARLQTSLLIDPGAWVLPGDGVVFRIGLSMGGRYTELLMRHLDPGRIPDHRHWMPIDLDLSQYAGRTIDLVFKTEGSLPRRPTDYRYDWALWGAPRLVAQ